MRHAIMPLLITMHLSSIGPSSFDEHQANRMLACSRAEDSILTALKLPQDTDLLDACQASDLDACQVIETDCGY